MIGDGIRSDLNICSLVDTAFNFISGRFQPGMAYDYCESFQLEDLRALAHAQLLYLQGDVKAAGEILDAVSRDPSEKFAHAAFFGKMICSLSYADSREIEEMYRYILQLSEAAEETSDLKNVCNSFLFYFSVLIHHTPDLRFNTVVHRADNVIQSLKPMFLYAYAHYLMQHQAVDRAIGIAEGALVFLEKDRPIAQIYLSLIASVGYVARAEWEKAEYYFRMAWEKAMPDRIIMPFAECRYLLRGMPEKCLRYAYPDKYKQIVELSAQYQKRWISLHNKLTGDVLTTDLASIEYVVASLAAVGLSNQEIADFLEIAVNSVRAHLRNIFNKLGINSRKELSRYIV